MDRNPQLAIVGAGPQALTLLAFLHAAAPRRAAGALVLDPSGRWLAAWNDAFDRLAITHLRSPCVHHPHPEVDAIAGRRDLLADDILGHSSRRPSQRVFAATCNELIETLGAARLVRPHRAASCRVLDDGCTELRLADGSVVHAAHVVLANNPSRRARIPGLATPDRQADLRDARVGEHITVVGGALTAAQLVEQAVACGAEVTMVARHELSASDYDVDPGWMGPKHLTAFERETDRAERVRMVARARGRGTIPTETLGRIRALADSGRIRILEGAAVLSATGSGSRIRVHLDDGGHVDTDRAVAAIGSAARVEFDPLLSALAEDGTLGTVLGHPVLDDGLRVPGSGIHVMGRLAAERLGPAAGNLAGARRAAARITASILGEDPLEADPGFGPAGMPRPRPPETASAPGADRKDRDGPR